jgi:hypothetical protein
MFGKEFKVLQLPMVVVYQPIGKYEIFYAHEKNGMLEYEILDGLFGQPSPANWDESEYAQLMRKKATNLLKGMIEKGIIELLED